MNPEQLHGHQKCASKLPWVSTGTAPLSAFSASVSLQGTARPLHRKLRTELALHHANMYKLAILRYTHLNQETIHIRLFSDDVYHSLPMKHPQIGFEVVISDVTDAFNRGG